MRKDLVRKWKLLNLVLRQNPDAIGLSLDREGWASIQDLLGKAALSEISFSREELDEILATDESRSFDFDGARERIRANPLCVIGVDLESAEPVRLRAALVEMASKSLLDDRVGGVLLLTCMAGLAGMVFWYPLYLMTFHSAPDDRYGFAVMYCLPFYFIGPAYTGRVFVRLMGTVLVSGFNLLNGVFAVSGMLLGLIAFSPLVLFLCRLVF
jgi:hypothetical protein